MAKKLSGSDMIRAALDADVTKPTDIVAWVKAKYRKTVKKSLINNVKQHLRAGSRTTPAKKASRRSSAAAKPIVAPSVAQSTEAGKSQSDLIREALQSGILKPAEIIAFVKTTHGADVSPSLVSQVKHKWAHPKAAAKSPKTKPAKTAAKHAAPKAAAASSDSIIDVIVTVKGLLERHGKESLNKLIDVL